MPSSVPCPTCQTAVPVPSVIRGGGAYAVCASCQGTFFVIDEESLPEGDVIEFAPRGSTPGAALAAAALPFGDAPATDESLRTLATGSLFLGGLSLTLTCIPALAVISSVCGLVLGLVSLNTSEHRRAFTGVLLNAAALVVSIGFFLQALQVVLQQPA